LVSARYRMSSKNGIEWRALDVAPIQY